MGALTTNGDWANGAATLEMVRQLLDISWLPGAEGEQAWKEANIIHC